MCSHPQASEVWDCVKDYVEAYVHYTLDQQKIADIRESVAQTLDLLQNNLFTNDMGSRGYESAFSSVLVNMQVSADKWSLRCKEMMLLACLQF